MKKEQFQSRLQGVTEKIRQNQEKVKSKIEDFETWVVEQQDKGNYRGDGIKPLGMARSTIYSWSKDLKNIYKQMDQLSEIEIEEKLKLYEIKTQIYSNAVEAFCSDYFQKVDPFEGKTWYMYYFHIDDKIEGEPTIGRVVLKTFSPSHVELTNIGGGANSDYEKGSYKLIYNYACFIDLETKYGDRKLHIKIRYISSGFEIFIGSYITYENDHVVRGTVVITLAQGNDVKPALLSSFKNKDLFFSLDPAIRSYLSLKKYNYQKISNKIFTIEGLRDFLKDKRGKNWSNRFIEEQEPMLFIAFPGLSLEEQKFNKNSEAIEKIVKRLTQRFQGKIKIYYDNHRDQQPEMVYSGALESLKKTRLFVLIYTKTDLGSYSLVQLGWAMAYCKVVMMFYELGSISGHLQTLHKKVQKTPFENGLDNSKTCEIIYKTIEAKIEESCEKWLQ